MEVSSAVQVKEQPQEDNAATILSSVEHHSGDPSRSHENSLEPAAIEITADVSASHSSVPHFRRKNRLVVIAVVLCVVVLTMCLVSGIGAFLIIRAKRRSVSESSVENSEVSTPEETTSESIEGTAQSVDSLHPRMIARPIMMSQESSIKRALQQIQDWSGNAASLLIDRSSFENDPGYVFRAYQNQYPLLIKNITFRDERGIDCEGITNDFLSQSLSWYEKRDDPVMDVETGIIRSDQNRTQIRDLSTFAVMCLAKEASARSNHVCSLTNSTLAPINIWLAMVDEDPHSPMFQGWKKNEIGSHFFSGKLKDWPDTDDEVQPFYVNILGMDEEEAPSTLREMVRYQTSNSSVIIRQVLRDYGLLSVVRSAFQTGTLMDELEPLWKPAWNKRSGQRLKQKVADLIQNYDEYLESFAAFGIWVANQNDSDLILQRLWQHWTGLSVITDQSINNAVITKDRTNESIHLISHTCDRWLEIPNGLRDHNADKRIRESLANTEYGQE